MVDGLSDLVSLEQILAVALQELLDDVVLCVTRLFHKQVKISRWRFAHPLHPGFVVVKPYVRVVIGEITRPEVGEPYFEFGCDISAPRTTIWNSSKPLRRQKLCDATVVRGIEVTRGTA